MMESKAGRYNEKDNCYDDGYFIVLNQQQLSLYKGDSKEGELLHEFSFPHGADYRFISFDEESLIITDNSGLEIDLTIHED